MAVASVVSAWRRVAIGNQDLAILGARRTPHSLPKSGGVRSIGLEFN